MGIFSFFSNLIKKKEIVLPEKYRGDIVYFVPLKKNVVELGTKAKIEHGFCLVVCYHNKVLDILRDDEGEIVLEDVTVPRLFKEHRNMLTKRGIVTPKTLPADVYFVKMDGYNLNFKTYEKFLCKTSNGKMKMRLKGNFDFCIKDMRKFMGIFCWEFAIVKNKKLGREISILVADEVSKILDKAELSFDIYTTCKDKVQDLILSKLNKLCIDLGIDITAIRIDDLIISKKEKSLHDLALKRGQEDAFLSQVEEELNQAQNTPENVLVTASNDEIILGRDNDFEKNNKSNKNPLINGQSLSNFDDFGLRENFVGGELGERNSVNGENCICGQFEGVKSSAFDNLTAYGGESLKENIFLGGFEKKCEQKEPNLFENDDESAKAVEDYMINRKMRDSNDEIDKNLTVNEKCDIKEDVKSKSLTKKCSKCGELIDENSNFCKKCGSQVGGLVSCPCCGAKNSAGSEICMVCKSKL